MTDHDHRHRHRHRSRSRRGPRDGTDEQSRTRSRPTTAASRRTFLKATAAGALFTSVADAGAIGTVTARSSSGIPTPWLERDGNLIRDPDGNKVILRGLNIADPKRIDVTAPARGKNALQVVDYATDADEGWYPRVIRVPVQPVDIGEHTPGHIAGPPEPPAFTEAQLEAYLETHLDPVIDRLEERGVYAIVDFHRHWSGLDWGEGTGENIEPNETLQAEVNMFWDVVAPRYADRSHVIYEMYNEPVRPGIFADPSERDYEASIWMRYKETAQPWVDTIRSHADNLTLVGSPSWSQSPEGALVEEFDGDNLAYTYHIYAGHSVSQDELWDTNNDTGEGVSQVYEEVPLFVTEFGWQSDISSYPLIGETSVFGEAFVEWMDEHPIHWTAWCFDPVWLPAMVERDFESGDEQDSIDDPYSDEIPVYCEDLPCDWKPLGGESSGEFIRTVLADRKDDDVPTADDGTDPTPPLAPPSDVWVDAATESSLEIGWEAVSEVDTYRVYLDGGLETEVGTTGATIADLESGTEYEIGVASVSGGDESDRETIVASTRSDDDGEGPPSIDGYEPADTTGDGLYNDVTGSGSTTTTDVTVFFENVENPAVTEYPEYYDFDGSGSVSITDVIELFESL